MLKAAEIKQRVDIFDLAEKLGLKRPGNTGNFKSPHHADKVPSLTLYPDGGWTDWSNDESGSVIDLVMYVRGLDFIDALRELHEIYGWPTEHEADKQKPLRERTLAEIIAAQALKDPLPVRDYLLGRGISEAVISRAIKNKTLGWNDWTNPKRAAGEIGYGGPGAAFVVKSMNPGHVVAVDMRYADPALNGGLKTSSQGEKLGHPWFMDLHRLKNATTVYVVESAINALSIESCSMPYTAAVATRGTKTITGIDWRFLRGKKVVAVFDNDAPDQKGVRPGAAAAWALHETLTALNITCHLVDWESWAEREYNDVNDILQAEGTEGVRSAVKQLEPWIIPGVSGKFDSAMSAGKSRVWLPPHDAAQYWRFRAKEDFVTFVSKTEEDEQGNKNEKFTDLCGFRVASISRVNIQSASATMSGEEDTQPLTRFSVSVQMPRYGHKLQRKVFEDERLHNVDHWSKFGPVFARSSFLRMINILERSADLGARDAVNFVGLAWRNSKPIVNEGPDCYFNEPDKQCPYHNLVFPSGTLGDARKVIAAYQNTFRDNAASILLVWGLGGHLKAYLGTWPHAVLQSSKGAGKSTLVKRMERTIGFTMFSGQSLQTEFRLLTSISHTSHPVGWEELSARRQEVIDKAVSMLQESYQYGLTRRGSDMTEYLQCAPVLLAGEDVPVKSLTGKLIRTDLAGKQGDLLPMTLPRFPVRQWLNFLAETGQEAVLAIQDQSREFCIKHCAGDHRDNGARRMVENYAGIMTAWKLLCDFAGVKTRQGDFISSLITTMNTHITETSADREPWVWILETTLNEISNQNFRHPYKFITYQQDGLPHECLLIRPAHIMAHIASTLSLRETWNSLPVKTARVFKQQLMASGVVFRERIDTTVSKVRMTHMLALDLDKLAEFNLHAALPDERDLEDVRFIRDGSNDGAFLDV